MASRARHTPAKRRERDQRQSKIIAFERKQQRNVRKTHRQRRCVGFVAVLVDEVVLKGHEIS